MKRFAFLLMVVMCLGVVASLASTDAAAQTLVPCCEGGAKPNKRCNTDANCPNACVGGKRDGKPCQGDANCPGACVGGSNDGKECGGDGDCPGACVGGSNPGASCFTSFECKGGGTCGPPGSCSNPGRCADGTCTAMCQKGRPPKTPSDPASELLGLPTVDLDLEMPAPRP